LELANLFSYPLPSSYFDNLHKALGRVTQKSGRLVTNIGTIKSEQGDDLSTISDMFIRRDDVSLVVVWGIIGRTVRISARNTDISRPLEAFLKDRFGESSGAKLSPQGTGIGGGMISLELGVWMTPDTVPEVEAMVSKHITSLVFRD
jgi:nanoRNase/pAp phosphatase (c-di-AMP/oligoRNAs hydrolase)